MQSSVSRQRGEEGSSGTAPQSGYFQPLSSSDVSSRHSTPWSFHFPFKRQNGVRIPATASRVSTLSCLPLRRPTLVWLGNPRIFSGPAPILSCGNSFPFVKSIPSSFLFVPEVAAHCTASHLDTLFKHQTKRERKTHTHKRTRLQFIQVFRQSSVEFLTRPRGRGYIRILCFTPWFFKVPSSSLFASYLGFFF